MTSGSWASCRQSLAPDASAWSSLQVGCCRSQTTLLKCPLRYTCSGARCSSLQACHAEEVATLIFYVPPHALPAVLADAAEVLGADRSCVVARELTKVRAVVATGCAAWPWLLLVANSASIQGRFLSECFALHLQVNEELHRTSLAEAAQHYSSTPAKANSYYIAAQHKSAARLHVHTCVSFLASCRSCSASVIRVRSRC
jgi:hypothetical protein